MNVYENMRCVMEDNAHLISMVPVEELLRFGYEVGLKPGMKVLDLLLCFLNGIKLLINVCKCSCNKQHCWITDHRIKASLPSDTGITHCGSQKSGSIFEGCQMCSGGDCHLVISANSLTPTDNLLHRSCDRLQTCSKCRDPGKWNLAICLNSKLFLNNRQSQFGCSQRFDQFISPC